MRSISTLGARRRQLGERPRRAIRRCSRGWATLLAAGLLFVAIPSSAQPPVERLSNRSNGQSGEGDSETPSLSADARFAVFASDAIDLVSGDRNQRRDVFLADRKNGGIVRISVGLGGAEANGNSEPGGTSPSISDDGCVIAFSSRASNLIQGDGNEREDVFVIDCRDQVIRRVSVGIDGEANGTSSYTDVSADGRFVVFQSAATNLVKNDGNGTVDIFVFDRETGETRRVSVASDGAEANAFSVQPTISGNGRFVAFASEATNLVEGDTNAIRDIFVHDRDTGETTRVSVSTSGLQADGISFFPALDFDGSIVAFKSEASNLEGVGGDTNGFPDVFVHDRGTGETTRVSVDSFGNQAEDGLSSGPALSADGRFVAFASGARNLVPEDGNLVMDIFVVDLAATPRPQIRAAALASRDDTGGAPDVPVSISANGRWIGFTSASLLAPNDVNNDFDAFVACNPFDPSQCAADETPTPTETPTATPTPTGFCNNDDDCTPPQVCVDHMCVDPSPTPTPIGFCTRDQDCPPPKVCVDNMCTDPSPTPTPIGFCTRDQDCPPPQVCVDNMCTDPSPTPTPIGFCTRDQDCPPPQVCVDNMCTNPSPTPTPIGFCTGNDDCPPPQVCVDNMCENPTPTPTPIGFCNGNEDCAPDEVCVDHMCTAITPTPTHGGGGGGGGCSCKIDPDAGRPEGLDMLALAVPALLLLLRGRRGRLVSTAAPRS